MGQVGTGWSTWDRWDWDRGLFRLGGTGSERDTGPKHVRSYTE